MPAQPFRLRYLENAAINLGILLLVLTGTALGLAMTPLATTSWMGMLMRINPLTSHSATSRGARCAGCGGDRCLQLPSQPGAGRQMRQLDGEAFEVPSCVSVHTPAAFASTPFDFQDWALEIRPDGVTLASFQAWAAALR